MNKFKVAVLAVALAFAGTANAGFYCKLQDNWCSNGGGDVVKKECSVTTGNTYANEHVLEYHWPEAWPNMDKFEYTKFDVVCFADAGFLYTVIPQFTGVKAVPSLSNGPTQGPGQGAKVGVIYRGDDARFLIDNIRNVPKAQAPNNQYGPVSDDIHFGEFVTNVKP
jgi:hypothetical protein